ncbi:MAG TPA: tRNA-(ms[2]io[6]A)-hydroxylase [Polyangiaceae bacterium]|nr:tRNA-(ms[2]io[6]A)-hydroxylase [Polyangiaceae bacterium]
MLSLRVPTAPGFVDAVFADFGAFLVDHAACEKKAFSNGMSLVSRYPERQELVRELIEFSREELGHFALVHGFLVERGLVLARDTPDEYARLLRARVRPHGDATLCDRLLVAGIIEARSCERLGLVADALPAREPALAEAYRDLVRAEARHHGLFFRLCRQEVGVEETERRAAELLDFEAELVARLPLRAAVH